MNTIANGRGAGVPPAETAAETAAPLQAAGQSTAPRRLALFCSTKCPGKLILDAYDACRHLRGTAVTVISGFHSPMEQECLRILLRGTSPIVWCLARGKLAKTPPAFVEAVAAGRLSILAPFPDKVRRVTAATCAKRNQIVADMADAVFVVHAAPGSKIEALSLALLAVGKPLFTFDNPANEALIKAGARPITPAVNWNNVAAEEQHT